MNENNSFVNASWSKIIGSVFAILVVLTSIFSNSSALILAILVLSQGLYMSVCYYLNRRFKYDTNKDLRIIILSFYALVFLFGYSEYTMIGNAVILALFAIAFICFPRRLNASQAMVLAFWHLGILTNHKIFVLGMFSLIIVIILTQLFVTSKKNLSK